MIFCSVIARPEKNRVIFEPLKTDGRADGNQKKAFLREAFFLVPINPSLLKWTGGRAQKKKKSSFCRGSWVNRCMCVCVCVCVSLTCMHVRVCGGTHVCWCTCASVYGLCGGTCVCGGLSTGYVAPCARCGTWWSFWVILRPEHLLFSYHPSRKNKTVIFEPLKTDGRADGNHKKQASLTTHLSIFELLYSSCFYHLLFP